MVYDVVATNEMYVFSFEKIHQFFRGRFVEYRSIVAYCPYVVYLMVLQSYFRIYECILGLVPLS